MNKCVIIPDSFKGTMSSIEICDLASDVVKQHFPDCEVIAIPVADGGEGTVDCFTRALGAKRVTASCHDPYMNQILADYCVMGETAIIEMAAAAGLPLVGERKNPAETTTYGVGVLMKHAIDNGASRIILGLGGSATNDCGCGCAAALGIKFYNGKGQEFLPTGKNLSQVKRIDATGFCARDVSVTAMCDIRNPMFGKRGAAYIFGPQKGADAEMVKLLDDELRAFHDTLVRELAITPVCDQEGTGAAGAFGAGVLAFFGGTLKPGIETVLDMVDFDTLLENTDYILTGEGKIDAQSMDGKVVSGIANRAYRKNVPVIVLAGDVGDDAYQAYDKGVTAIFSINRLAIPYSEAKKRAKQDYQNTLGDILRLIQRAKEIKTPLL